MKILGFLALSSLAIVDTDSLRARSSAMVKYCNFLIAWGIIDSNFTDPDCYYEISSPYGNLRMYTSHHNPNFISYTKDKVDWQIWKFVHKKVTLHI